MVGPIVFLFFSPKFALPNGAVAQLVEQRTENPCVGGSIPPHTTSKSLIINYLFDFQAFLYAEKCKLKRENAA